MASSPEIYRCPSCGAPVRVVLGDVEVVCEFCGSLLRFSPTAEELEIVRTREEMKRRERVEVQKAALRQRMEQEEMERWRRTAASVALQAMPVIGDAAGRALFRGVLRRGGGCGVGCLVALLAVTAAVVARLILM